MSSLSDAGALVRSVDTSKPSIWIRGGKDEIQTPTVNDNIKASIKDYKKCQTTIKTLRIVGYVFIGIGALVGVGGTVGLHYLGVQLNLKQVLIIAGAGVFAAAIVPLQLHIGAAIKQHRAEKKYALLTGKLKINEIIEDKSLEQAVEQWRKKSHLDPTNPNLFHWGFVTEEEAEKIAKLMRGFDVKTDNRDLINDWDRLRSMFQGNTAVKGGDSRIQIIADNLQVANKELNPEVEKTEG